MRFSSSNFKKQYPVSALFCLALISCGQRVLPCTLRSLRMLEISSIGKYELADCNELGDENDRRN